MTHVEVQSINEQVVLIIPATDRHQQRFVGYTVRGAHELVTQILEAINSAQGFDDAMAGKIKTPTDCPRCKARNVTPRHVCKRVRA